MNTDNILKILNFQNKFWATGRISAGIERELLRTCLRQRESKEIIVLKGVRRSGKSTLMAQIIQELLQSGVKPTEILLVNLEEPLFSSEYSIDLLERVYRTYRERVQPTGHCYLFVDEIQNIPSWETWIRGRQESENMKIFLAGSSSLLLSPEIGTKLTGRQVSLEVFPLSFREYLRFQGLTVSKEQEYYLHLSPIRKFFYDYLQYGGFPEVALKKEEEEKELLLKNYFEDILYRDLAARGAIRDVLTLRNLVLYLLANVGNITSINKLKNNFSISQDKVQHYLSVILESYLLFALRRFTSSLKTDQRSGFKIYAVDTGLRNRVALPFSRDWGRLVENMIFTHLRREFDDLSFGKNDGEVDFILRKGITMEALIQVWYADENETTIPPREIQGFCQMKPETPVPCMLLTNDLEKRIELNSTRLYCLPVTKFLLFAASPTPSS